MLRICRGVLAALIAATAVPARAADAADLLKYAPAQANAVVVINMAAILATPRAQKEGWAKADHTEFLAGAVPVNPNIERVVVVKEVRPHAAGRGRAFAIAATKAPVDMDRLARLTGGTAETAGGEPVVITPLGSILFPLDKSVLGVAWTDTKQDVARWARVARASTTSPLSPYLNAAVFNYTRHHVLIALDTEDLFDARQASMAIGRTKAFAGDKETADAIQRFVTGLRGVVFAVTVTADGLSASVKFDSNVVRKINPDAFKTFVIELLARNGATFDDLPAATATAEERSVTLRFKLSDPELARLMGLFLPPLPRVSSADQVPVTPAGVNATATLRYVQAVNRILDDLKRQTGKNRDYNRTITWHDAAANRIDTVSVLNVDPVAVDYGVGTSGRLRAIADSLRGVPAQMAELEGQIYSSSSSRGLMFTPAGPRIMYGVGGGSTNAPQIQQRQAAVIKQDQSNREKLWDQIDRQRAEVRRVLAEKYKIDTEGRK